MFDKVWKKELSKNKKFWFVKFVEKVGEFCPSK